MAQNHLSSKYSSTRHRDGLPESDRPAAQTLIEGAAVADGIGPVSEDARLALAHGRAGADFLLARTVLGEPAGYAFAGPPDEHGGRAAELVVAPEFRRQGLGADLAAELIAGVVGGAAGDSVGFGDRGVDNGGVDSSGVNNGANGGQTNGAVPKPSRPAALPPEFWAHGDHPAARRLAASLSYAPARELHLMALAVDSYDPPEVVLPADAVLRTFQPGVDEEEWLALNRRAFAHHPEQGAWTMADLAPRLAGPWFDPAGFFLLSAAGRPAGFHWTKVHPAGEYGPDRVGEVYVVGVDPDAQGRGFGRLLTVAGVNHLARLGLGKVVLYVDADNTAALRLYRSLGFEIESTDVMYAKSFR